VRGRFFTATTLRELFEDVRTGSVIDFIKAINLYRKLYAFRHSCTQSVLLFLLHFKPRFKSTYFCIVVRVYSPCSYPSAFSSVPLLAPIAKLCCGAVKQQTNKQTSDTKTISADFVRFSFKLLTSAHGSTFATSAAQECTLAAGTTRYVSSAYLCVDLPVVRGCRSDAVTT
jgi:hypothetical protein